MKTAALSTLILLMTFATACAKAPSQSLPESNSGVVTITESQAVPIRILSVQQYENREIGDVDAPPWVTLVEIEALSCHELYDGDFDIQVSQGKLKLIAAREFESCFSTVKWQRVIASTSEIGARAVIEIEGYSSHRVEVIDPQY